VVAGSLSLEGLRELAGVAVGELAESGRADITRIVRGSTRAGRFALRAEAMVYDGVIGVVIENGRLWYESLDEDCGTVALEALASKFGDEEIRENLERHEDEFKRLYWQCVDGEIASNGEDWLTFKTPARIKIGHAELSLYSEIIEEADFYSFIDIVEIKPDGGILEAIKRKDPVVILDLLKMIDGAYELYRAIRKIA